MCILWCHAVMVYCIYTCCRRRVNVYVSASLHFIFQLIIEISKTIDNRLPVSRYDISSVKVCLIKIACKTTKLLIQILHRCFDTDVVSIHVPSILLPVYTDKFMYSRGILLAIWLL